MDGIARADWWGNYAAKWLNVPTQLRQGHLKLHKTKESVARHFRSSEKRLYTSTKFATPEMRAQQLQITLCCRYGIMQS